MLGDRTSRTEHAAALDERLCCASQRRPVDRLAKLFRIRGDDPHAGGRLDRLGHLRIFGPLTRIDAQQFDAGRPLFFPILDQLSGHFPRGIRRIAAQHHDAGFLAVGQIVKTRERLIRHVAAGDDQRPADAGRHDPLQPGPHRERLSFDDRLLGYDLALGQQSLRFGEQKVGVHKRLVADVLPADVTVGVDQIGAVQRDVFKIVVGPILAKHVERSVGDQREGNATFIIVD